LIILGVPEAANSSSGNAKKSFGRDSAYPYQAWGEGSVRRSGLSESLGKSRLKEEKAHLEKV